MAINEQTLQSFLSGNLSVLDEIIGTDASELKNILNSATLSGMAKSEILNQVSVASSASAQKAILNTRLNTYSRVATNTMMKDAPSDTKYVYVGPIDEKTRPECLEYASAGALTEADIIGNGWTASLVDGGGINCRHKWEIASSEGIKLFEGKKAQQVITKQNTISKPVNKLNDVDKLLGTEALSSQINNRSLVTGRLDRMQVRNVWADIYKTKEFNQDLNNYHLFLKEKGLLEANKTLNNLWVDQIGDGEGLYRYLSAKATNSRLQYANGKYFGNNPKLLAEYEAYIEGYAKRRFKNYSITQLVDVIKYDMQFNQNMLKRYGLVGSNNKVKVYRGIRADYFKTSGAKYPKSIGEAGQLLTNSAESWSTNQFVAEQFASVRFGGVVIEMEVPLDRIISSNFSFSFSSKFSEAEIVLGGGNPLNYKIVKAGYLDE